MADPPKVVDAHNLNEGYYGPSIPPAHQQPRRSAARSMDAYSLLCIAFRVTTLLLIAIGIIVLVLWLVYQPDTLKVYVDHAALARFDLAANASTLRYNLTLQMSVRNPNRKYDIHYKRLEVAAFYGGSPFGYVALPKTRQRRKSTMTISPSFHGQSAALGEAAAAGFKQEEGEGFFSVGVKMYTKVRLKMIVVQSVEYTPEVDCYLRIPAPGNATALAAGFTRTECNVGSFS